MGDATRPTRVMLTTDAVGGVWRWAVELAAGLATCGARVLLVVMGPPPSPAQHAEAQAIHGCELRCTGLSLEWLASEPRKVADAARVLARLAAEWGAETIQVHAPALAADAVWPAPVIATAHSCVRTWWQAVRKGPLPPDLAWRAQLTARGLGAAGAVIAPSESFALALLDAYRLERPIYVVPNGCRPVSVVQARRPQALTAGRLWDEGKNVPRLDEAAGMLDARVLAAGPVAGPNGATIACRHLRLLGTLDNAALAREYATAAAFVSVSCYEPFGLAVLEAAQSGCALILSDIPTFRELWKGAALFVPPDDPAAIATALRRTIADEAIHDDLAAKAQARAVRYTTQAMTAATWRVHRDLAETARTVRAT